MYVFPMKNRIIGVPGRKESYLAFCFVIFKLRTLREIPETTDLILQTYLLKLFYMKAVTNVSDFKISFMYKEKGMCFTS